MLGLFLWAVDVSRLPRAFFGRPTVEVARDLLGRLLVRRLPDGAELRGRIVETEAYRGEGDTASHASRGRTPRNAVMFGPPGYAYVYLIYGMYHCLNVVTEPEGVAGAVLIRAVEPVAGLERMKALRPVKRLVDLTNGPGKLCRAFAVDRSLNGEDCVNGTRLWLEAGQPVDDADVGRSPRIGVPYADEKDRKALWRFFIKENEWVSR